ncbi:unnamed protein product [Pieris brassicae]|uniref:DUF2428 domain-containing protein n=1 Tax=Pieris brassicae TaxID=7116 RepID=A0A9P0TLX0_PIEBR|nr:unnamed protein product [Pieris brassicae]
MAFILHKSSIFKVTKATFNEKMDMGENVLMKLSVPTYEVTTLILQEVLSSFKKVHGNDELTEKILHQLWKHIMTKLFEFDDQLLCSTCFYTLLTHSKAQNIHLHNILNIINNGSEEFDKGKAFYAMTLMYGLFQSSYLTQKNKQQTQLMEIILEATFKLLMQEAYKYSQYTFIAFKIISAFKKVIDTNFQSSIFNRNNQITLLNVVNHNWENPITGVRNLIRNIFQTLVSILDKDIYHTILKEINGFYWNKAKFLMLTEIIEQSQSPMYALLNDNGWLHGLIYSLHKPGLVSCGSDMYFAVLKNIKSDDEWCEIFFKDLHIIFNGTSHKAIENFYNYWCLITLKKFPMLLDKLLFAISKEKTESSLLSALCVMKQEEISNQFMSEENSAVSYDFSRMNELVESLIEKSSTDIKNNDETKISGLHQVVLNCLWLNVKMSCDTSALLIMYVEDENICNKCLNVIVHVLETCRHKGAIEAAGSALGKSIQHLTSLPVGSDLSKLPFILLERKLKELLLEAKMASVTRRGAGLSIMVHRIVSSDMKKGKPLFHYFMNILLEACKDLDGINDCNPEKDLPKAIHIHFLTRIVMDSSLASEMMFYSARLAEVAFNNLRSSHWQIRNAALQLYGALIPKLIGQKKASGLDEETVSTVACDEFRTHSPKLWDFIGNQLENTDDNLLSHSDLVPILNILSSVARSIKILHIIVEKNGTVTRIKIVLTIL